MFTCMGLTQNVIITSINLNRTLVQDNYINMAFPVCHNDMSNSFLHILRVRGLSNSQFMLLQLRNMLSYKTILQIRPNPSVKAQA